MTNATRNESPFFVRFFNEIALYSGQYALFFIFMKIISPQSFWASSGNIVLICVLIIQTTALVYYGHKIVARLLLSFLSPLVYTVFEMLQEGMISLLNTGHIFFWISTMLLALFYYIGHVAKNQKVRFGVEFVVSNINILIFIFIYFFFDLKLKLQEDLNAGKISEAYANEELFIWRLDDGFIEFLDDPAHIYIIMGGVFLSLTIAYSRIKILQLSEKIDTLLVRYIGAETRDKLIKKNLEPFSTKIKTVLIYADIRNFTTLSEKADASDVVAMLNYYYGIWHENIKKYHGTINKFIGDALLAFFDYDKELKQNANHAVTSALEMIASLERINKELLHKMLPPLDGIGIGIHCGEVILGDIGGERKDYTLIGDVVNTTARLEELCKLYDCALIISEACYILLDARLQQRFRYLSSIAPKGKEEKVTFYGLNH